MYLRAAIGGGPLGGLAPSRGCVRAGRHHRRGPGHVRRGAAGRHGRSGKSRPDREDALGRHRRHRPVSHRRSSSRHLRRDVHAARLQHREARGHRAEWRLRRHGQRRPASRHPRRDDHGHRRIADRRRPERARADHHRPGCADGDPLVAKRHRHSVPGSGDEQQRRLRRHHRRERRDGRLHPWRPRLRFPDAPRRHQHRVGRRQLERRHLQRGGLAGSGPDDIGGIGRSRDRQA